MHRNFVFCALAVWTFSLASPGEDIVRLGAGSYAIKVPAGAELPPPAIFRTGNVKGPVPTNDWWSSLAWTSLSDVMYPHPLAVRAVPEGVRVYSLLVKSIARSLPMRRFMRSSARAIAARMWPTIWAANRAP